MKRLCLLLSFLLAPACLRAQEQPINTAPPAAGGATDEQKLVNPFYVKRHLQLKDADLDEQIVQLARIGDANLIADATDFPAETAKVSADEEFAPYYLFRRMAISNNLTMSNEDAKTILFWSRPDMVALAHTLVNSDLAASIHRVEEPMDARSLDRLLSAYFQRTYHWNGVTPGFSKDIPIRELPPEIRTPVIAWAQASLLPPDAQLGSDSRIKFGDVWFNEGEWQGAVLRYSEATPPDFPPDTSYPLLLVYLGPPIRIDGLVGWLKRRPPLSPFGVKAPPETVPLKAAPPVETEPATPQETVVKALSLAELNTAPELKAKVSFEVKRQSLRDLLTDLQKQSGVTLEAAPGSPAERYLLTAHVQEMPLSEVMASLSRLYGIKWTKQGENYTLHGSGLSEIEQALLGLKDIEQVDGPTMIRTLEQGDELAISLLPHLDVTALRSKAGFPVARLPQDLQDKIRHSLEAQKATQLVTFYRDATEAYLDDGFLHAGFNQGTIHRTNGATTVSAPTSYLAVQPPNGMSMIRLPFHLPPPPQPQEDPNAANGEEPPNG